MKRPKLTLLYVLMLLPFSAFAHGEVALVPFFFMIIAFIAFFVVMAASRLKVKTKAALFFIYTITAFASAAFLLKGTYSHYLDHEVSVNTQLVIYPIAATLIGYFLIKKSEK